MNMYLILYLFTKLETWIKSVKNGIFLGIFPFLFVVLKHLFVRPEIFLRLCPCGLTLFIFLPKTKIHIFFNLFFYLFHSWLLL